MIFLVSCIVIYALYPITTNILERYSEPFQVSSRKNYIVKNIIKSIALCLLVIACLFLVFPYGWDNDYIKSIASAYVANDFVGLLTCKLPRSTLLHHTVSCIFLVFAQYVDFNRSLEARMLFYYSFFSACCFFVNLYLGLRLIMECEELKLMCKYLYPFFLIVNWCIQIFNIMKLQIWYLGLLAFIVYDDVILLTWLWR